jgi:arsenate reductase
MKNILFLCTGNSCRSQMAEAWAKHYFGDKYSFHSAGIEKHGLNPLMLKAMKAVEDITIDMTGHTSKLVQDVTVAFDVVFTVCGHAHETCPFTKGEKVFHRGFDDPPFLTKEMSDETQILDVYKKVRDEIREFAKTLEQFI